ncbi:hypothetical protein J6590_071515 [Homalodisca vitripennis]|nr:hypothetical protein J6590_071515 [Homalodisca vitripennis]
MSNLPPMSGLSGNRLIPIGGRRLHCEPPMETQPSLYVVAQQLTPYEWAQPPNHQQNNPTPQVGSGNRLIPIGGRRLHCEPPMETQPSLYVVAQ